MLSLITEFLNLGMIVDTQQFHKVIKSVNQFHCQCQCHYQWQCVPFGHVKSSLLIILISCGKCHQGGPSDKNLRYIWMERYDWST